MGPWAGATVAASVCLLLNCAAQGPPQPPRIEKPERVSDLAVAQVGRTLELSFTLPVLATDGERLSKPLEVQIFRTLTPPGHKPVDATGMGQPWATLLAGDLRRFTQGEKVRYPNSLSEAEFSRSLGSSVTFAVRGLTRGFRYHPVTGDLSNVAQAVLLDVSGPVEGLAVQTTEHALELSWQPPVRSLSGGAQANLAGYRVYKSKTGKPGSFQLLAETASAAYQDRDFQFRNTYFYEVRAVFKQNGEAAESEDSQRVETTPLDTFPPAPPTGLTGIFTTAQVALIWNANTEPDLAGYNVYRSDNGKPPRRINRDLVGTPIFHDSSVERGRAYAYRVTAVDREGNESLPSAEVQVSPPQFSCDFGERRSRAKPARGCRGDIIVEDIDGLQSLRAVLQASLGGERNRSFSGGVGECSFA